MRILLIQPLYENNFPNPPLGLGYIASALEEEGHNVQLIDLTNKPLSDYEFERAVQEVKPELVGISLMCRALPNVAKIVASLKRIYDIPVVLGGPQVTVMPSFTLRQTKADFAVVGEGENTVRELVHHIEKGEGDRADIDGLAFVDNDKVRVNAPRRLIQDLDLIPFPAWHLMPPKEYDLAPVLTPVEKYPVGVIITTRGCPYECNYCAAPKVWGRTFRRRSPQNVVDEIELLVDDYGVKELFLSDDNFTLVRKHATDICGELMQRRIDVSWACPNGVRIDRVDRELLRTMRKAGCHLLGFGIESGSQRVLDRAKKHLDLGLVRKVVRMAKEEGITTYGFFILGLLGETTQTIRETIDFAKSLPLDRAWFNILEPYPGTEVFEKFAEAVPPGEIDWSGINGATGMIAKGIGYANLSAEDLVHLQRKAVREFYLRPRIAIGVIRSMNFRGIKTMTRLTFFKRLLGIE